MQDDTTNLIDAEIDRAHCLHGIGFETGSLDVKLRILVEEVGEIARAIQDVSNAERARSTASTEGTTEQLEAARCARDAARAHLLEEVVQVAATAVRWIETEREAPHGRS